MSSVPSRIEGTELEAASDVVAVMPDFPYNHAQFLSDAATAQEVPFTLPPEAMGQTIAIVGGGASGIVAGYELLRAGFCPIILEGNGRIGGRMYSRPLTNGAIAEMGAMRFPPSAKTLFHYFGKVGMTANMAPFPNPASSSATGTVIDYRGETDYFDVTNPSFPMQQRYVQLAQKWDNLLMGSPINLANMQSWLANPQANEVNIKNQWNSLLALGWDNLSFHQALVNAGWTPEDIALFGQVGFGSGGWNTNYVNSFLELLRVAYTALETGHMLCYQGVDMLPKTLFSSTPQQLGDISAANTFQMSLEQSTKNYFQNNFGIENILTNTVLGIEYNALNNNYYITLDSEKGVVVIHVAGVVYTPHVRVLQMMSANAQNAQATRALLSASMWEAIEYTHYMQSAKTFVEVTQPFWKQKMPGGKYQMSVTLSDRLTRGTYLLDYNGAGAICTSYTWNDDALKFLPFDANTRFEQTMSVLQSVYPEVPFADYIGDTKVTILWDSEPFFLGAFKNNLPGQYMLQRRLYAQFAEPETAAQQKFVLAGDDISWTGGWAEGAVTTAINAVHAIVAAFGGAAFGQKGPLDRWDDLKPKSL